MELQHINSKHQFARQVIKALHQHCNITEPAHILVAVSGGADSVALLCGLSSLANLNTFDLKLTVGHVNHHLRGEESDIDCEFTKNLAEDLGLDFLQKSIFISKEDTGNIEAIAREKRYQSLKQMALESGASIIATAHHGDDQLETILMRIMRGSSITGLGGINWRRNLYQGNENDSADELWLIRPLLSLTRQQIKDYLNDIDISWREDHTNNDISRTRARLRKDILPVLKDIRADTAQRATELCEHMRQVNSFLEKHIEKAKGDVVLLVESNKVIIDRTKTKNIDKLIFNFLLRQLLSELGASGDRLTRRAIEPIVQVVYDNKGGKRSFDLSGNIKIHVSKEQVELIMDDGFKITPNF